MLHSYYLLHQCLLIVLKWLQILLKKFLISFEVVLQMFVSDVIMMNGGVVLVGVDIFLELRNALLMTLAAMSKKVLFPHIQSINIIIHYRRIQKTIYRNISNEDHSIVFPYKYFYIFSRKKSYFSLFFNIFYSHREPFIFLLTFRMFLK
jgi:hypothetical protein